MFTRKRTISLENRIKFRHNGTATRNIMSKFLDSRFNKISYLTPLFLHLISPQKLTFLGVESEGRFRRVVFHVFGIQKRLLASRISDGPDGPKFDVRARGFPRAPSACRRAGCCPFRCSLRSAPGGHPPAVGLVGLCQRQGCASPVLAILAMLALRAVRGSGLLRAALDPAPSLKTRLRASQSLVDTFKRPSGATGHRIALGGPLRPPDGHSGPAWSSPAPQAWFRGSAPAPQPVRL